VHNLTIKTHYLFEYLRNCFKMRFLYFLCTLGVFFCGANQSIAQNCGLVDSLVFSIVDNGNGTSDYSFVAHYSTTSGGSKSVLMTIYCGTDTMVSTNCQITATTPLTMSYGPFTRNHCTSPLLLDWSGHTNTICGGSSCAGDSGVNAVPVSFLGANYNCESQKLSWSTASELNNAGFHIQQLKNGNWSNLGWVSGVGTSNSKVSYFYNLPYSVNTKGLYRLKQVDFDNEFSYSDVIEVNCDQGIDRLIFPNPAQNEISLNEEVDKIEIVNAQGVVLYTQFWTKKLDITGLEHGFYQAIIEIEGKRQVIPLSVIK
jgi:hypothetical protein